MDLPAPFGPRSPKIVPDATARLTPIEGAHVARVRLDQIDRLDGRAIIRLNHVYTSKYLSC